ncbi:hypothetical protein D3C72_1896650 [compost metagenome]
MLAELTGEHAVNGVECHTQQHPHWHQREQPSDMRKPGQQQAKQHGNHGGAQGHLVGGHAALVKTLDRRAQQRLEAGFELVDRRHGETPFTTRLAISAATARCAGAIVGGLQLLEQQR